MDRYKYDCRTIAEDNVKKGKNKNQDYSLLIKLLLVILIGMISNNTQAYDAQINGFCVYLSGTEAYLTNDEEEPIGYSGTVVIPEILEYNGTTYTVTRIYGAFGDNPINRVIIPRTISLIGTDAFDNCPNLTSVVVKREYPPTISETSFPSRNSITLYVPYGTSDAYKAAEYWKQFEDIVELSPTITFADANVEAICVHYWDTNSDGELSEAEAAAVTNLGTVFKNNTNITSFNELIYFTGLSTIEEDAFLGCSSLSSISMPSSITSIGARAFTGCNTLSSVHITDLSAWCNISFSSYVSNPLYYGHHLFMNGEEITDLVIPDEITFLKSYAFSGGYFSSVTIPSSCLFSSPSFGSSKDTFAFSHIGSITINQYLREETFISAQIDNLVIAPEVTGGGIHAFYNTTIGNLEIPYSSNTLGYSYGNTSYALFDGCTIDKAFINRNISSSYSGSNTTPPFYNGTISELKIGPSAKYTADWLCGRVTINDLFFDGVTDISANAFYSVRSGNNNIHNIHLSNGISSIGSYAFYNCGGLNSVIAEMTSPPAIDSYTFSNRANATLHVPAGSKTAYEAADYWGDFNIVELETEVETTDYNDGVVIAEKDWTGEEDFTYWCGDYEDVNATCEMTADGVAITNPQVQEDLWTPQTMVLDGATLQGDHSYCVVITAKIPSDGQLQVNMGNWGNAQQYEVPVTASDDFQEIVVMFDNFPGVQEDVHVLFQNGGIAGTCVVKNVKVVDMTEMVSLSMSEVAVQKGNTVTLTGTVYPASLPDRSVTWTSSNTSVATVTGAGQVTGVGGGTATITCTSVATGLSATCKVTVGKVTLSKSKVAVQKGNTVTLTGTVYPTSLPDRSVTWKSSNTSVATVTSAGKVTGVGGGTATITCTSSQGFIATCTVTVGKVAFSKSEVAVQKGNTVTLTGTVYPTSLPDRSVTWKSSNTSVATVTSAGKVTGVGGGTATITCTSSQGFIATCTVTVGKVTLSKSEIAVQKGNTVTLTGTVYPTSLSDRSVTWKSSNPSIASVTGDGKVTGVSGGIATITCTSSQGYVATCKVTVGKVTLNKSEVAVQKGNTVTLTGIVYPTTLPDRSVTWKSSNPSIASVTGDGKVTGVSGGIATITCNSSQGYIATCQVTVTASSNGSRLRSSEGNDNDVTGIENMNEDSAVIKPFDVYDLSGNKVLHCVTSLDGLPNGIYIVNGKKIMKKNL